MTKNRNENNYQSPTGTNNQYPGVMNEIQASLKLLEGSYEELLHQQTEQQRILEDQNAELRQRIEEISISDGQEF